MAAIGGAVKSSEAVTPAAVDIGAAIEQQAY
jgi:hypothetical protein